MLKAFALAIQRLVTAKCGSERWPEIKTATCQALQPSAESSDEVLFLSLSGVLDFACEASTKTAQILGQDKNDLIEECGKEFLHVCVEYHGKVLFALGNSLCDFLNNLDNFIERFTPTLSTEFEDAPSFHCIVHRDGCYRLEVQYQAKSKGWEHLVAGLVKTASFVLFRKTVEVTFVSQETNADVYIRGNAPAVFNILESSGNPNYPTLERRHKPLDCFRLCCLAQDGKVSPEIVEEKIKYPSLNGKSFRSGKKARAGPFSTSDLGVDITILCNAFPFHVIFTSDMQIQQLGAALGRLIGPMLSKHGRSLDTYFELIRPSAKLTFKSILSRRNRSFCLLLKAAYTTQTGKDGSNGTIELKGQMIHMLESNCIMYLGSVVLTRLEELRERALFLSDIPIHDAARDLILVSEQALAQNALRKRMQELKSDLDTASLELAREKKHTEDLLEAIFPHDVARKLVHRQPVPAEYIEDVSILFSDIVGFTPIAAKASPMDVVELLNNLYTTFDRLCEDLDLYKVETIGDAYVVAGGIHNSSGSAEDARKVALMGLGMIDATKVTKTPDGTPIQMRIGIHTGAVLSGVVGTKMPRYCLFGNNVTIANKIESESEGGKVNVSPTTYVFISKFDDFFFAPRVKRVGFASHVTGTCYFLNRK